MENDLIDILSTYSFKKISAEKLCHTLLPLLPRLYSIASAQCEHPDEVHLVVSHLKYEIAQKKKVESS